jgi:hypothetical protein
MIQICQKSEVIRRLQPLKNYKQELFAKNRAWGVDVAIPSCRRSSARTARKLGVRRVGSEILGQHSHVVVIEHARIELRHGRQNGRQETVVATSREGRRSGIFQSAPIASLPFGMPLQLFH